MEKFIEEIAGLVRKYAASYGIRVHSPIIAQAILESAHGTSELATNVHNYFGLKWRNNRCPSAIGYYIKSGKEQNKDGSYSESEMKWFKFPDMEAGVRGYFDFINIANYANLKGVTDPEIYLENIKADGYATSIKYVDNLLNVIDKYDLRKYDDTEEKSMFKVCIDAGHYAKYNRCPGIPEYYESEIMWKLHLLQKKHLEALGVEVITTRSNASKDLSLKSRGKKAQGCHLFISDHSNAVGGGMNESIDYVAAYHLTDDSTTQADNISKEMAKKIAPIIAALMKTKQGYKVLSRKSNNDRNGDGMMNDNYYGVLHGARSVNVPGLILEHSFHTNTKAVRWLLDEKNLDELAKAEAECIYSFLKEKYGAAEGSKEPEANVPYLVRIKDSFANVRSGAGSTYKIKASVKKGEVFTIVEEKDGLGKLKSGAGWICLNQTEKVGATKEPEAATKLPYLVKITADALNVRAGAGTTYKVNTVVKKGGVYTIVEENAGWGKLKSGAGWICLKYTEQH